MCRAWVSRLRCKPELPAELITPQQEMCTEILSSELEKHYAANGASPPPPVMVGSPTFVKTAHNTPATRSLDGGSLRRRNRAPIDRHLNKCQQLVLWSLGTSGSSSGHCYEARLRFFQRQHPPCQRILAPCRNGVEGHLCSKHVCEVGLNLVRGKDTDCRSTQGSG